MTRLPGSILFGLTVPWQWTLYGLRLIPPVSRLTRSLSVNLDRYILKL